MLFIASAWLGNSKFKVKLVYNPPPPPQKNNKWEEKVENIFFDETSVLGEKRAAWFAKLLGQFPCRV